MDRLALAAGAVFLFPSKRVKLLGMVQSLLRGHRTTKKDLEWFIGLALWACNLLPVMRSLLHYFYHASNYSVPPSSWWSLKTHLSQDLEATGLEELADATTCAAVSLVYSVQFSFV